MLVPPKRHTRLRMLQGRGSKSKKRNTNGTIKISNRISMQNNKIMKKLATKLTPAIKEWIKEEFGSEFYKYDNDYYFHFPNSKDFNGFLQAEHLSSAIQDNYTLVSEQEFLEEFSKPVQYQCFLLGIWVDIGSPIRIKPQPDYSQEIEALNKKANQNGFKAVITFEKL